MPNNVEHELHEKLLRQTYNGNIDWDASHSGFQDEVQYDTPLYASVDDKFYLRIDFKGTLEVTKDRVIYEFDLGKMGEDIYRAAREASSLDFDDPEEVIEALCNTL